jgi:hypothetical protein
VTGPGGGGNYTPGTGPENGARDRRGKERKKKEIEEEKKERRKKERKETDESSISVLYRQNVF